MGIASAGRRGVSTTVVDASDTAKENVPIIIRRNLLFEISPTSHQGIVRAARGHIAPAVLVYVHFTALVKRSRKKGQAPQNHQQRRDLTTLLQEQLLQSPQRLI
jgi:hypothetical protein